MIDTNITEDMIFRSSGIVDVYSNGFDKTWHNTLPEDKRNQKVFTSTPFEEKLGVDDGSVEYVYNSDFFRCDEFGSNNSKYHVVFSGCSETEGIGGNLNEAWGYKTYLKLKEKYDIGGYYSLGKSGNGWHKIALSLIEYSNRYGTPTHFFVLLPNIGRNFYWNKNEKNWRYDQKYVEINRKDSPHGPDSIIDLDEHKRQFMEFAVGWKIFQNYCFSNNIKVLYSTWDRNENSNLSIYDSQFKCFHEMNNKKELEEFIRNKYPDFKVPKKALKKRDGHEGDVVHEYWSSCFIKEIMNRGMFND